MDPIARRIAGWLAGLVLCLLVACGGGGGDSPPPTTPQAGSADIDASGGSVQARLDGGATVALDVPAGAYASATTLRIDPGSAAAGELGHFDVALANQKFAQPLTLTVTLPAGIAVDADTTLLLLQPGAAFAMPLATTVDVAARTLRVTLEAPVATPLTKAATKGAVRAQAGFHLPPTDTTRYTFVIQRATYGAALNLLDRAVSDLQASGTDANADAVYGVMTAILNDTRRPTATEARVIGAAQSWAVVVCPQQAFALSALNSYNGVAVQTFETLVNELFRWGRNALDVNLSMAAMVPQQTPGCPNAPASEDAIATPVRQLLPPFLANVKAALDLLNPANTADFDQVFRVRYKELLDLAADFKAVGLDPEHAATLAMLSEPFARFRAQAWSQCRDQRSQVLQARLISMVVADPLINPLAPQDLAAALYDDAQYCGMAIHWQALDANGAVLAQGDAGGMGPGVVVRNASVPAADLATLRIAAPLLTLFCPDNSANAETLVFDAMSTGGAATNLRTLTPFNLNLYQVSGNVDFAADAIQQTGPVLRMRRSGDTCHGLFADMTTPSRLVDFTLDFGAPQIATPSLPDAQPGVAYSTTLQASGGRAPYRWTVADLPAGLALDATTGVIAGTTSATGTYTLQIGVTDANARTAQATATLVVSPAAPLVIGTAALPTGVVGLAYSAPLSVSGGAAPYAWSAAGLPNGLSIAADSGVVSGTPTAVGASTVVVDVHSADGRTGQATFTLTVVGSVTLTGAVTTSMHMETHQPDRGDGFGQFDEVRDDVYRWTSLALTAHPNGTFTATGNVSYTWHSESQGTTGKACHFSDDAAGTGTVTGYSASTGFSGVVTLTLTVTATCADGTGFTNRSTTSVRVGTGKATSSVLSGGTVVQLDWNSTIPETAGDVTSTTQTTGQVKVP